MKGREKTSQLEVGHGGGGRRKYLQEKQCFPVLIKCISTFVEIDTIVTSTVGENSDRQGIQREKLRVASWNTGSVVEPKVHVFTSQSSRFGIQLSTALNRYGASLSRKVQASNCRKVVKH